MEEKLAENSDANLTKDEIVDDFGDEESLKVIENISDILGISKNKRITFELDKLSEDELKLTLSKAANFSTPWFGIKDKDPYVFMPAEILNVILGMLKNAQRESFELKLEKAILQRFPIDFGDVWRVAINKLANSKYKREPNLDKIVEKIKHEHPNLFLDLDALIEERRGNNDQF